MKENIKIKQNRSIIDFCYILLFILSSLSCTRQVKKDFEESFCIGDLKKDIQTGTWKYYNKQNNSLLAEMEYKDGVLNGDYKCFYEDGGLKLKGKFKDGVKNGSFFALNIGGDTIYKIGYKNDLKEGEFIEYYESGNRKYEGKFKKGIIVNFYKYDTIGSDKLRMMEKMGKTLMLFEDLPEYQLYCNTSR